MRVSLQLTLIKYPERVLSLLRLLFVCVCVFFFCDDTIFESYVLSADFRIISILIIFTSF